MREYFLDNDYTHLIICPDDLLVKPKDLEQLIYDIPRFSIVSGFCNVDSEGSKAFLNITSPENLPHANPRRRRYEWISFEDMKRRTEKEPFKVGYSGFALMAIQRDVITKLPFRNDGLCCIDVMFCWDCAHSSIPIYVDPKIKLIHLKIADGVYDQYQQGKKQPFMYVTEV